MSVSERFMTAMELPGDLSCKAPIITITGPSQVQIENYKSILSYTSEKLIVVTSQGRVILQGKNLEIFHYTTWATNIGEWAEFTVDGIHRNGDSISDLFNPDSL